MAKKKQRQSHVLRHKTNKDTLNKDRTDMAVIRLTGQDAALYNPRKRRGPKEEEAAAHRAPDLIGERVRPTDSAPYLDPSFSNTAPPSQTPTRTPDPLFILDTFPLWTLLFYYLC